MLTFPDSSCAQVSRNDSSKNKFADKGMILMVAERRLNLWSLKGVSNGDGGQRYVHL